MAVRVVATMRPRALRRTTTAIVQTIPTVDALPSRHSGTTTARLTETVATLHRGRTLRPAAVTPRLSARIPHLLAAATVAVGTTKVHVVATAAEEATVALVAAIAVAEERAATVAAGAVATAAVVVVVVEVVEVATAVVAVEVRTGAAAIRTANRFCNF